MEFSDQNWHKLIDQTSKGLKLNQSEKTSLEKSQVAKLFAATAYAADCETPDRLALMLLSLMIVEVRGGSAYDTQFDDLDPHNITRRIEPFFASLKETGNQRVIKKAIYLLSMKMISHWIETQESDPIVKAAVTKYKLNLEKKREELKNEVILLPANPVIDRIMPIEDALYNTWWSE